jgi:hypothetical protein
MKGLPQPRGPQPPLSLRPARPSAPPRPIARAQPTPAQAASRGPAPCRPTLQRAAHLPNPSAPAAAQQPRSATALQQRAGALFPSRRRPAAGPTCHWVRCGSAHLPHYSHVPSWRARSRPRRCTAGGPTGAPLLPRPPAHVAPKQKLSPLAQPHAPRLPSPRAGTSVLARCTARPVALPASPCPPFMLDLSSSVPHPSCHGCSSFTEVSSSPPILPLPSLCMADLCPRRVPQPS